MPLAPTHDTSHWYNRAAALLTRFFMRRASFRHPGLGWRPAYLRSFLLLSMGLVLLLGFFPPVGLTDKFAEIVPAAWVRSASEQVQAQLDRSTLKPPLSSKERIETVTTQFASLRAPLNGAPPYRLLFRNGGQSGFLLYSLPDGIIVIGDELLNALSDDTEVLAMLCHELGHIHYRHALRTAIQHQALSLGIASLLGLENQAIGLLSTSFLDSTLPENSGAKADEFARKMLEANGIPTGKLESALKRLAALPGRPNLVQKPLLSNPSKADLISRLDPLRNDQ